LKRKIIITSDGSTTIHLEDLNEQYHSIHGAIQEAYHVFIKAGLNHIIQKDSLEKIAILEIGFGTGLNAFISCLEAERMKVVITYDGIEAYPVPTEEIKQLNYSQLLTDGNSQIFGHIHEVIWEKSHSITNYFNLKKRQLLFSEISTKNAYNLIYFDAFGARVQPELWTEIIFKIMYDALILNGILVTYSAKGSVRRAMQKVGFQVERLEGPPGKRHMLRATK